MDEAFARYLGPGFRYSYWQNPARVRSREDALRDGLNCVALAHLVIRDLFGFTLPAGLQTYELIHDRTYFEPDITNMRDFPVKHVAVRTDDDVLLHASGIEGTTVLWPLERFGEHDKYRRIYAIRRLAAPGASGRTATLTCQSPVTDSPSAGAAVAGVARSTEAASASPHERAGQR